MALMRKCSLVLLGACLACSLLAVACGPSRPADVSARLPVELPPLVLASVELPVATVEEPYSATLAFLADASCEITSGGLPPGLTLDAKGNITGTPRVTGDWGFEVTATDGRGAVVSQLVISVVGTEGDTVLDGDVRTITAGKRVFGLLSDDLPELDPARVELGRMLFFDKELSGTRDVACATCHSPSHGYADGLSFSVGVGSNGKVGPGRRHPGKVLIPRNSPAIFNVGLMPAMFWDKRVRLPLGPQGQLPLTRSPTITPEGPMFLEPDEAQALFPIADVAEMRGLGHELDGLDNATYRLALVDRLKKFPEYVRLFDEAFGPDGMTVENMARAIAAFERSQTFVNSAWDRYLLGDRDALTDAQKRGAALFFSRANCDNCHNGPLLTDFVVRSVIVPQFGPGRGKGAAKGEDYGVEEVVNQRDLRYNFRTPTLRNIALTAPYMHNGAYNTLRDVVLHYRDKEKHVRAFDVKSTIQAEDLGTAVTPTSDFLRRRSFLFTRVPSNLTEEEVDDLVAFLETLTDPAAVNRRNEIPATVPSGLPVDR
jgi:cytochrome c peroxidase